MPSTSKAQQSFMAICEHHPQHAKGKCPDMTKGQLHDFAATPRGDLPDRAPKARRRAPARGGRPS